MNHKINPLFAYKVQKFVDLEETENGHFKFRQTANLQQNI